LTLDACAGQPYDAPRFIETAANLEELAMAEAYCVKCKSKKEIANAQQVTMKNGRPAIQGTCPDCGTKLFRIEGGKKA
jgi:Zn finger protein HypA/HybF involved in hydrogenase expression